MALWSLLWRKLAWGIWDWICKILLLFAILMLRSKLDFTCTIYIFGQISFFLRSSKYSRLLSCQEVTFFSHLCQQKSQIWGAERGETWTDQFANRKSSLQRKSKVYFTEKKRRLNFTLIFKIFIIGITRDVPLLPHHYKPLPSSNPNSELQHPIVCVHR